MYFHTETPNKTHHMVQWCCKVVAFPAGGYILLPSRVTVVFLIYFVLSWLALTNKSSQYGIKLSQSSPSRMFFLFQSDRVLLCAPSLLLKNDFKFKFAEGDV